MRVHRVEHGHRLKQKLMLGLIRLLSGRRVSARFTAIDPIQ